MRAVYAIDRRKPAFNLFTTNCNWFAGRVARAIGLRAPRNHAQFPKDYLQALKALNSF